MSVPLSDAQLAEYERNAAYVYEHSDYSAQGSAAAEIASTDVPALIAEVRRLRAELEQAHAAEASATASLARIQHWATETEHGKAAAEVLLLIRDLVDPDGEMDQADGSEDETLRDAWNEVREALIHGASAAAVLDLMDGHDRATMLAAIARQADDTASKEN